MYTIDTSVWVNATEPSEVDHAASRTVLRACAALSRPVFLPMIVLIEVAGTVARLRGERRSAHITRLVARWPNTTFVPLVQALADEAAVLARQARLRGADAVYAAVVQRHGTTLISRDRDHLTRLVGIVPVLHPADALAELGIPPREWFATPRHPGRHTRQSPSTTSGTAIIWLFHVLSVVSPPPKCAPAVSVVRVLERV